MLYILSLGGSLIVPDRIDSVYLKKFRDCLVRETRKGHRFVVITGGGATCRQYQEAARAMGVRDNIILDWIGIQTCNQNAYLLKATFSKIAHPEVLDAYHLPARFAKKVAVGSGGMKPGGSSDSTSLVYAQKFGARVIVNLTNVAGVYDRDPRQYKNVELKNHLSWREFQNQFGRKRRPGQHLPFDSSVSEKARKLGMKVVILNGANLPNFEKFLANQPFVGTVID